MFALRHAARRWQYAIVTMCLAGLCGFAMAHSRDSHTNAPDTDGDGQLTPADVLNILHDMRLGAVSGLCGSTDLNHDGKVDVADLKLFGQALAIEAGVTLGSGGGELLLTCEGSPYTLTNGDTDSNLIVDDADITNVILDYGGTPNVHGWSDIDGSAVVDDADLTIVILRYGESFSPALTSNIVQAFGDFELQFAVTLGDFVGNPAAFQIRVRARQPGTATVYEKVVTATANPMCGVTLPVPSLGQYEIEIDNPGGHWLGASGAYLMAPSILQAHATGADDVTGNGKITLYWDPVAGATHYRLFRATSSGGYNFDSPLATVPNDPNRSVMRWTDASLTIDPEYGTEYFYVVKAVAGSLVSGASPEDSDAPDVLAIPWDTDVPYTIIAAIRTLTGIGTNPETGGVSNLDFYAMSPDGFVYNLYEGMFPAGSSPSTSESTLTYPDDSIIPFASAPRGEATHGGVYRVTSAPTHIGVRGKFLLPNCASTTYMNPADASRDDELNLRPAAADKAKPYIYFGTRSSVHTPTGTLRTGLDEIDAGLLFHPRGFVGGLPKPRSTNGGANWARWQAFVRRSGADVKKDASQPKINWLHFSFFSRSMEHQSHLPAVGDLGIGNNVDMSYSLVGFPNSRGYKSAALKITASSIFSVYYATAIVTSGKMDWKLSRAAGNSYVKRIETIAEFTSYTSIPGVYMKNIRWQEGELLEYEGFWVPWTPARTYAPDGLIHPNGNVVRITNPSPWYADTVEINLGYE